MMSNVDSAPPIEEVTHDRFGHPLARDQYGQVMFPQDEGPWAWLTFLLGMVALPIALHLKISPLPPLIIERTPLFKVAISQDLLSRDQVRNLELVYLFIIGIRLAGYPAFLKKYTGLFSEQCRPPDKWITKWPGFNRLFFKLAMFMFFSAEGVGLLSQYTQATLPLIRPAIFCFGLGFWFFMSSVLSTALYSVFYRKYWKPVPSS